MQFQQKKSPTLSAPASSTRYLLGSILTTALASTLATEAQGQNQPARRCTINQVFFTNTTAAASTTELGTETVNLPDIPHYPHANVQIEVIVSGCNTQARQIGRIPTATEYTSRPVRGSGGVVLTLEPRIVPVELTCTPTNANRLTVSGSGVYHLDATGGPVVTVHFNNLVSTVHSVWPNGLRQSNVPCQLTTLGQVHRRQVNINIR